ncbi:MAG: hypothetical protein ABJF11_06770 [Reichenbachiella sp.]|uniref:nSTAND1 domain-containing NTPase n=1 Tax=Reichenbachiella sp. TaxID=2184521 RepID=UPI0032647DFD
MDISTIKSAFKPSSEISDPNFFAGRKETIKKAIIDFQDDGAFMVVHGLRGVGKSSVAKQLKLIAEGDKRLIKALELEKFVPRKGFNYLTHVVTCDGNTKNTESLLSRILAGADQNPSLFSNTNAGIGKIQQLKTKSSTKGSAKIAGLGVEGNTEQEKSYITYSTEDVFQHFKQLLGIVRKDNLDKNGILFIIDEFDVLKDKSGFSSLVKTCSNDFVKFMVVGIANTISELVEDHSSVGRQLKSVDVDKMSEDELWEIIVKAERSIGKDFEFTDDAAGSITKSADGFPYFVHLLGGEALMRAFETGQSQIDKELTEEIKHDIANGKLYTLYEEMYHDAVKNSQQREILLKLFAQRQTDEIFSETIYSEAKADWAITNPTQLMKELTKAGTETQGVLTKVREKYYRFTDPVFKVYANLRTFKF